ncbi:MAG: AAA family ATPase [Salinibacterium sp.]|nr:AAA family ATPase [Salinibacterium sp.]
MPNQLKTSEKLVHYLKARVPFIVVRSIERSRALDVIRYAAGQTKAMSFYTHSRTKGLQELNGNAPVTDDRSLVGALDYATSMFTNRENANFIFTEIEDLDSETPTSRHLAEMARLAETRQGSIIVIASSSVWSGLSRLGMSVTLDLPDIDELRMIIDDIVELHRPSMKVEWMHEEIRRAAEVLIGVTQTEAVNAITTMLAKGSLLNKDVAELSQFKDQILGDLNGIDKIPLNENDYGVGGLSSLRDWLRRKQQLMSADLTATPLHPPKGVLLVGVPGCGKSLQAKAIAAEWQLPLYRLDMATVLGMYVGQSEGQLKAALEAADQVAPCVLWIDEIEKGLAGGNGDSGTTRRLVGQFLFWLQESTSKVFLVATANDVQSLPPELLRKGRFDEIFFVDLPDESDRAEIIRMYFLKYLSADLSPYLVEQLVELSEGFSGADLESAIHDIATEQFITHTTELPTDGYITDVFSNVVPFSRTNPEEVAAIRAWGRERAVPAGRESPTELQTGSGRRVVVMG